ncbi:MAG: VWA domain-containing protein [Cyclobacteriaceae bacterium]|nr:MAG: VWA domain-containing protein [Cyclobacteriaceae bacterium]
MGKIFYLHYMKAGSLLPVVLFMALGAVAQSLSEAQQKAINNYITMVNQLSNELAGLGPSLAASYRSMLEFRNKPRPVSPYSCRMDEKKYYFEEAQRTALALGAAGANFKAKAEAARLAWLKVDETCKAIEVYFRLKDYESDNFKRFEELVGLIDAQVQEYAHRVGELQLETEKLYARLQPHNAANPYHKASKLMRDQLVFEHELLDALIFNVNEQVHTGWPVEKAQKHILDDSRRVDELKKGVTGIQYPASSMYTSFVEGIESLQSTKRNGVDGYTYEKQQSDEHSNGLYKNLINYYNHVGVSFYENFVKQSVSAGFRGIYYLNFVPVFSVRSTVKEINLEVKPFVDRQTPPFTVTPVSTAVPPAVFNALSNYIQFINEGMAQVNHMMNPMHSLNSSASYGKMRLRATGKMNLEYYYKNFEVPVTHFQRTIDQGKTLPVAYQKPLNDQVEVLHAILTELNQWNTVLLANSASKQLTKDSMDYVYGVIERFVVLANAFDEKKERLYQDVRRIMESYKPASPKSSWQVSGNAMLALLDENHKELYKAKRFLLGDSLQKAYTEDIERMSRELIVNEYTNLEGIQKYGRSNGNCPYTPYEDFAEYAKRFAESLKKLKPSKTSSSYYRHPYNELIYQYNQVLIRDYNKFAELSKVPLLKAVMQVELFEMIPHRKAEPRPEALQPSPVVKEPATTPLPVSKEESKGNQKDKRTAADKKAPTKVGGSVVRDTVRITDIIRIETVRQDTVYVSRVDTVYVGMPGENIMSMEGYATNNIVLLLDISGSMNSPDKLPLLKKSVLLLMKMMRPEDQVSIVTYSGKAKVELPPTSFKDEIKITQVIERLKSDGKTDGIAGIKLAYQVADKNYIRGGNNRIILATDGEFPIGNPTYEMVKKFAGEDIFITVFNFGKGSSAKNLQQLAAFGKGNYEHITRENVDLKLIKEVKAKRSK